MELTRYDFLLMEQNYLYNEMLECHDINKCADMMIRIEEVEDLIDELNFHKNFEIA